MTSLLALLFFVVDWRSWLTQAMSGIESAGPWAFFAAMALLPAVGFPIAPFNLMAGPAFSSRLGLGPVVFLASVATAANVAITYCLARRALRPFLTAVLGRLGYRVPEFAAGNSWTITVLLRLTPGPPFFIQSYLLGLAGVPFRIYFPVSWLIGTLYGVGTILFGDALVQGRVRTAVLAAGLLVALALGLRLLRRGLAGRQPAEP